MEYLIDGWHGLDHFLGKSLPCSWWSDQDSWLDCLTLQRRVKRPKNAAMYLTQREREMHTLTASNRVSTGSCSWAQGFLKCWSDSKRDLTINPYKYWKKKNWNLWSKKEKWGTNNWKHLSLTFESTSEIFLRVSSTGAPVCIKIKYKHLALFPIVMSCEAWKWIWDVDTTQDMYILI